MAEIEEQDTEIGNDQLRQHSLESTEEALPPSEVSRKTTDPLIVVPDVIRKWQQENPTLEKVRERWPKT